jgi:hypothetical protein
MLRRFRSIIQYMVIALTYKIKATGSWRAGEIMVLVFLFFCVVLIVCNCIYHDVRYDMVGHSNLVHKPIPSYVATLYGT